mgnify:FL=1|jgi:uncharacterized protein YjiS (DUF1127 family)
MNQLILTQANFLQKAISGLFDLFKDIRTSRKEISEAKQTIRELNKLSDADLTDIGLCRGDIWNVAHHKHDDIRRRF